MTRLKKFWIVFLSMMPFGAGAVAPFVVGGIAGIGVIAGFSIYRTVAPVNPADALSFFSTCWSCQMFSDIIGTMSNLLPPVYDAIGAVTIPIAISITAIWFAWQLLSGYLGINKTLNPWEIAGGFGTHILKLGFIVALLAFPLPRLITNVAIEPIFSVGLSLNRVVAGDDNFNACIVATAVADPETVSAAAAERGAFSPKLRHNLACELAGVHQMTALGMTVGWTMLNMSFNADYMHRLFDAVPIFPNIPVFFAGVLILLLFFYALLPIPIYLLEVFIKLSMDLIMLPLMLLAWLFSGWKIVDWGGKTLQSIINDCITGTVGIALVGVFTTFAVMFLNAIFGNWGGATALRDALMTNDAKMLMDGLFMNNDSLITIILMGLFIAMFMSMIPALIKTLFTVTVPENFYKTTADNVKKTYDNIKKIYDNTRKAVKKSA